MGRHGHHDISCKACKAEFWCPGMAEHGCCEYCVNCSNYLKQLSPGEAYFLAVIFKRLESLKPHSSAVLGGAK